MSPLGIVLFAGVSDESDVGQLLTLLSLCFP